MKNVILFDLGNTLVRYYVRSQFPGILQKAIADVQDYLREESILKEVSEKSIWNRVEKEDYEAEDHSTMPLESRLVRIFQLDGSAISSDAIMTMCRRFMKPIFALAHRYDDVLPVLRELGDRGIRKAIISNTPWGSPADLWREEMERLDLRKQVELIVFCRDVGWRKPARQIFEYTLEKLQVEPQECVFVGDDPRWDLAGPRSIGMQAILIDRRGVAQEAEEKPIKNLYELLSRLQALDAGI
jgi:putative hydrolase of the HAD superfamily